MCKRLVLVEVRLEDQASKCALRRIREQRLDALVRPGRCRLADELDLDAREELRLESVQAGREHLQAFPLVEAAEEREPLELPAVFVCNPRAWLVHDVASSE